MKNIIILNENDNFEVSQVALKRGEAQYFSVKYPEHEKNQDSLAIFELQSGEVVMLVSDGMGGHAAGEVASKLVCDSFKSKLKKGDKDIRDQVLDAIEHANQKVKQLGNGAGATLTCCSLEKGKLIRFYNVGDSSQFQLGSRGKLKYKGVMHSPLGHGLEAGIIKDRVKQDLVEGHIVSNGIGFDTMRIDISEEVEIAEGDIIILASDGVTDLMNEQQFIQWAVSDQFSERLKKIIDQYQQGKLKVIDDSTIILYRHQTPKST